MLKTYFRTSEKLFDVFINNLGNGTVCCSVILNGTVNIYLICNNSYCKKKKKTTKKTKVDVNAEIEILTETKKRYTALLHTPTIKGSIW